MGNTQNTGPRPSTPFIWTSITRQPNHDPTPSSDLEIHPGILDIEKPVSPSGCRLTEPPWLSAGSPNLIWMMLHPIPRSPRGIILQTHWPYAPATSLRPMYLVRTRHPVHDPTTKSRKTTCSTQHSQYLLIFWTTTSVSKWPPPSVRNPMTLH